MTEKKKKTESADEPPSLEARQKIERERAEADERLIENVIHVIDNRPIEALQRRMQELRTMEALHGEMQWRNKKLLERARAAETRLQMNEDYEYIYEVESLCRRLLKKHISENKDAVTKALDTIAELCGCSEWEYPGQVVRDVEKALKGDKS